jgi:hypothetical protein
MARRSSIVPIGYAVMCESLSSQNVDAQSAHCSSGYFSHPSVREM